MKHSSTHTIRGFCALCTAHCATVATVLDGKVARLEADHDHPNGGVFCLKGKAAPELVYHPDRLNHPLKRTSRRVIPMPDGKGSVGNKRLTKLPTDCLPFALNSGRGLLL